MAAVDYEGLAAFALVAERGGFSAAAARLGVSPSAVSQKVRALEDRLGVRLFERTTRAVRLTEAGIQLLAEAGPSLRNLESAVEGLHARAGRPTGTLRLTASALASELVLGPHLAAFHRAYPGIVVELSTDDGLVDIVAGGFDAGIRLGERLRQDMMAVRLGADLSAAVVGSPAYLAEHAPPLIPEDLHAHACINYRRLSGGDLYRWEFTVAGRDIEIGVEGPLTLSSAALMRWAALDGMGLAYLIDQQVADDIAAGRLVRVLEPFCPPFAGHHLYYSGRRNVPAKLRAFIDFLKARLG